MPTTAGMPSERAMIAECEVGPPPAVQKPRTQEGSSPAASEGGQVFGDQDDRYAPIRLLHLLFDHLFDRIGEAAQHARADVAEVSGAPGDQRIVHFLQRFRLGLDRLLPGPAGALPLRDARVGPPHQAGIGEELGMGEEDGGAGLAGFLRDVLVELLELRPCRGDRVAQPLALALGVLRGPLDDDPALAQQAHGAGGEPRGRGEPGHGRGGLPRHPAVRGAGEDDLLFLPHLDLRLQSLEGGGGLGSARGDAQRAARLGAELQKGPEALAIRRLRAGADEHVGIEPLGGLDERGRRARVQPVRTGHHGVGGEIEIRLFGRRDVHLPPLGAQRGDHVERIAGDREAADQLVVVQDVGEIAENFDVLVGLRRDADNDVRGLSWQPGDPGGHLEDGDAGALDQRAVFRQAVRDRDALAEIGVGHLLARQHALGIAWLDAARADQQLGDLADGALFRRGLRAHLNVGGLDLQHKDSMVSDQVSNRRAG